MIKMQAPPLKPRKKIKPKPHGAGVLCLDKGGKILIGKRAAYINDGGQWGFPGGGIEKDERFIDAALREFEEETGYDGEFRIIDSITFSEGENKYKTFILIIPHLKPTMETNEETEIFTWVSLERLKEIEPRYWIVDKILNSGEFDEEKIDFYISFMEEEE